MTEYRAHCKINLGLRVVSRRDDGFHNIETVMIPVPGLFDTVSVSALATPSTFTSATPAPYAPPPGVFPTDSVLQLSGNQVDCPPRENICMRALHLLQSEFGFGPALVRLHKTVPFGAGLGGGSADAAVTLRAVNQEFALDLSDSELEFFAARLGSDVPFFLRSGTQFCTGRGEIMSPLDLDLAGFWLAIAKPAVSVSTAEAYTGITPNSYAPSPAKIVELPVEKWRENLHNDFEISVLARFPQIAAIKQRFYDAGALYASMSGSGSAVFALFDHRPRPIEADFYHSEVLR